MRRKSFWMRTVSLVTAVLLALPLPAMAQNGGDPSQQAPSSQIQFSPEELAQLVAPIALYPDELVAQILMGSTYPLEIVEADRWVQQNKNLKGDSLARALEQKNWDPSVKSLVNFPSVLSMMSQKLEVTSKLGDAFLNQEKDVMDTVQLLRKKAYDAGNLKPTQEQQVVVEKETIIIQPANPEIIYVPTYNPTVVYGAWMYPAYPPYPYYAYPPPAYGAFAFATGIAVGLAWGYAWGGCNWHGGNVNVNVYRNTTINNTYINRTTYQKNYQNRGMVGQNGQGTWQHDASHRKGVAYRNTATAQKYGQSPARTTQAGRDARGYGDNRGGSQTYPGARPTPGQGGKGVSDRMGGTPGNAVSGHPTGQQMPGGGNKAGFGQSGSGVPNRAGGIPGGSSGTRTPAQTSQVTKPGSGQSGTTRTGVPTSGSGRGGANVGATGGAAPSGGRDSAFSRSYGDGASTRAASDRGQASRQTSGGGNGPGGGGSRPSSFGGGGGSRPSGGGGAPSGGGHGGGGGGGGGHSGGGGGGGGGGRR